MAETKKTRWEEMKDRYFPTPEERAELEQQTRILTTTRRMLMEIDEARRALGLSKAELARSVDANPATIRRLFTMQNPNPGLQTIFKIISALGLEMTVVPRIKDPLVEAATAHHPEIHSQRSSRDPVVQRTARGE